jgi:hypothetical protein
VQVLLEIQSRQPVLFCFVLFIIARSSTDGIFRWLIFLGLCSSAQALASLLVFGLLIKEHSTPAIFAVDLVSQSDFCIVNFLVHLGAGALALFFPLAPSSWLPVHRLPLFFGLVCCVIQFVHVVIRVLAGRSRSYS